MSKRTGGKNAIISLSAATLSQVKTLLHQVNIIGRQRDYVVPHKCFSCCLKAGHDGAHNCQSPAKSRLNWPSARFKPWLIASLYHYRRSSFFGTSVCTGTHLMGCWKVPTVLTIYILPCATFWWINGPSRGSSSLKERVNYGTGLWVWVVVAHVVCWVWVKGIVWIVQ